MSRPPDKPPRRRRPAAETREALLVIAERQLREAGPGALHLDSVAAELGVSRQAVLHHFGSREGLQRAVVERAWTGLFRELTALSADADGLAPAAFVDRVDDVARRQGHARTGGWLLLAGEGLPGEVFAGRLTGLAHGMRASAGGTSEDAELALLVVGAALFGDALFGGRLREALGLADDEASRARFRAWLTARLWSTSPAASAAAEADPLAASGVAEADPLAASGVAEAQSPAASAVAEADPPAASAEAHQPGCSRDSES